MANHRSALKRHRQSLKRRARNRTIASSARSAVKKVRTAAASGDAEDTAQAVRSAESLLRRAASKGVLPRARVDRQVSRLSKLTHSLKS